jgi:hypothetical protein
MDLSVIVEHFILVELREMSKFAGKIISKPCHSRKVFTPNGCAEFCLPFPLHGIDGTCFVTQLSMYYPVEHM